jgi:hypothetical protein
MKHVQPPVRPIPVDPAAVRRLHKKITARIGVLLRDAERLAPTASSNHMRWVLLAAVGTASHGGFH